MAKSKINLDIVKRLLSELEIMVDRAEAIKVSGGDKIDWMIELNKASGLASGIMTEGALLMGDIQSELQGGAVNAEAALGKLLSGIKGPKPAN